MHYTGYQDINPADRRPRSVEEVISFAEGAGAIAGVTYKHKALDTATHCAAKMAELRAARAAFVATAQERSEAAGRDYAAGKISAGEVLMQAATAAQILDSTASVQRQCEVATAGINREGLDALATMTEQWWLAPLQARAKALLNEAHAVADRLAIEPRARRAGVASSEHPWAPSRHELEKSIDTRHDWERLEHLLLELDQVHQVADDLRRMGYVPTVPGRDHSEDYRWRLADRLQGNPAEMREFFLMNRAEAEPGLFTSKELADAAPPTVRELGVDRYNAAVLAGRV